MQNAHLLSIETALLTPRTVFRRLREGEGAAFHTFFQRNHVRLKEYMTPLVEQVNGENQSELWVRARLADWLTNKAFYFAIWERESAKLIGFIALVNIDWSLPKAEIILFIDRDFIQKGLMTEVLKSLVNFSFEQLKMQKLIIKTPMEYYPAQRLARKCGFNREGDLRSEYKKPSGEVLDIMLFGLSLNSFEKY